VLIYLLDNAVKHGGGGPVTVRIAAANGAVQILVADSGPGIPLAEQQRIFEKFYRAGRQPRAKREDRLTRGPPSAAVLHLPRRGRDQNSAAGRMPDIRRGRIRRGLKRVAEPLIRDEDTGVLIRSTRNRSWPVVPKMLGLRINALPIRQSSAVDAAAGGAC
jgi:hypothetical protein